MSQKKKSQTEPTGKEVAMTKAGTTQTKAQWTATMASEDYPRKGQLLERLREIDQEAEEAFAALMAERHPTIDFDDRGICAHVAAVIVNVCRSEPDLSLDESPTDGWDVIRGYYEACDEEWLCDVVFDNRCEAFNAGGTLAGALAIHNVANKETPAGSGEAQGAHDGKA